MKAKQKSRTGKTQKAVVREDSPLGLRAAARLWIELGRSDRHAGSLEQWSVDMQICNDEFQSWRSHPEENPRKAYSDFKWFLIWCCRQGAAGNSFTAEYLRAASNPAATLRKNIPMIQFYWEQFRDKDLLPMMKRLYEKEQQECGDEEAIEDLRRFMEELNDPDWRCPNCEWDGDELVKECRDCEEEWMMNHEPLEPTVLELPEDAFGDGSGFSEEEVE
jgi:hypothetical protein